MTTLKIPACKLLIMAVILLLSTTEVRAQLTDFQTIFFENQYLANPAMAGRDKGFALNLGYQSQWSSLPGSPKLQNLTAEYNAGNRVGLGMTLTNDVAGLISDTRLMGTYAYHLPINETGKLNFGLSFGLNDSYIDYSKLLGDVTDAEVAIFNNRKIYLDGDAGISYTTQRFNLQATLPNLGNAVFNTAGANLDIDRLTFFSAASYNFLLSTGDNGFTLEPKLAFRGIKGFQNIVDGGANLTIANISNVSIMYHNNQSVTVGAGLDVKQLRFTFSYTNNTGQFKAYANNTFEMGIKYRTSSK